MYVPTGETHDQSFLYSVFYGVSVKTTSACDMFSTEQVFPNSVRNI